MVVTSASWLTASQSFDAPARRTATSRIPRGTPGSPNTRRAGHPRIRSTLVRFTVYPLLAFLIPVALSFWAASRLTRGIDAVAAHADAVAHGGLRRELGFTSGDEVGRLADAVRRMTSSLRGLLRDIDAGAGEVAATAEQLASGAQQMSASTQQVAGAAHSIADSVGLQT